MTAVQTATATNTCDIIGIHQLFNEICNSRKILDIRPREEYDQIHIQGSTHIDIQNISVSFVSNRRATKIVCIGKTMEDHQMLYSHLVDNKAESSADIKSFRSLLTLNSMKSICNPKNTANANTTNTSNTNNNTSDDQKSTSTTAKSTPDLFAVYSSTYPFTCVFKNVSEISDAAKSKTEMYRSRMLDGYVLPNIIIPDKLYLGNQSHRRRMCENDGNENVLEITHILNITQMEFDKLESQKELHISIDDVQHVNIAQHFEQGIEFIHSALYDENGAVIDGNRVFVHCQAGISRSSSMIMAYLMSKQNYTLYEAYKHTFRCRPRVHPNDGFYGQLLVYEKELFDGKSTAEEIEVEKLREARECIVM